MAEIPNPSVQVLGRLWVFYPRLPAGARVARVDLGSVPDAVALSINWGPRVWAKVYHG